MQKEDKKQLIIIFSLLAIFLTTFLITIFAISNQKHIAKKGDSVVISYKGYINNVAFSGGSAEEQTLILGSNSYIKGFEEQLIGHKDGDKVDIKVKFPSKYLNSSLANKIAVFKTQIIKVYPKK